MPKFSALSLQRLKTCNDKLQLIFLDVILITDCVILEGHRGEAAQNLAYGTGHSKLPWPLGKHNAFPSNAVDAAPYLPGIKIDWKDLPAFGRLMGIVQAVAYRKGIAVRLGMDWDGDFRTASYDPDEKFLDAPHVELKL